MSDWIEVNLPWFKDIGSSFDKPFPVEAINKVVREKFGATTEELGQAFKDKWGVERYVASYPEDTNIFIPFEATQEADKLLIKLTEIKDFLNSHSSIPELDEWNRNYNMFDDNRIKERAKISFYHSELCRPGVLIKIKNEDEVEQYLIGDINKAGGVCDCCSSFNNDTIVLKAKVVWNER